MRGSRRTLEALFPDAAAAERLAPRGAAAMAALAASPAYAAACLVECRIDPGDGKGSIVIVDIEVPLGQRGPVNDVRPVEPVAFHYVDAGTAPAAYPLREDFPEHLPHINTSWVGEPRSLCLFEMPPEEVLRIATPHVMLERVRWWLAESAHGRLHGAQQPLDPFFAMAGRPLVLPSSGLAALGRAPLIAVTHDEAEDAPVFLMEGGGRRGPARDPMRRSSSPPPLSRTPASGGCRGPWRTWSRSTATRGLISPLRSVTPSAAGRTRRTSSRSSAAPC